MEEKAHSWIRGIAGHHAKDSGGKRLGKIAGRVKAAYRVSEEKCRTSGGGLSSHTVGLFCEGGGYRKGKGVAS